MSRQRPGEQGAAATEFVILIPVVMLLFGLVVGGARVWLARDAVSQAASSAARAASLARTAATAEKDGRLMATAQLQGEAMSCHRISVVVTTSGLRLAAGTPGQVQARVGCAVSLADLLVPGWPGELELSATATSVVDRYRGRG